MSQPRATIGRPSQYLPATSLPRKQKKQLKAELMRRIHKSWKSKQVRVLSYRIKNGRKVASSYSLGY